MSYVIIETLTDNSCAFPHHIRDIAEGKLFCARCQQIWEEIEAVDVMLYSRKCIDKKAPFTFMSNIMVPIVHVSFLECFRRDLIERDFYLGRVYCERGTLQEDWVTVRGRYRLIVRGTEYVTYRTCEICRRPMYFSNGGYFLYPKPPEDVAYFTCGPDFIVRAEYIDMDLLRRVPKVSFEEVPVVDSPLDSYGLIDNSEYRPPPNPHWELPDL